MSAEKLDAPAASSPAPAPASVSNANPAPVVTSPVPEPKAGDPAPAGTNPGDKAAGTGAPAPATGEPKPGDKPAEPPKTGVWAEDWREQYAGDDAAKLNFLKRLTDPKAALDSLFAAQEKIRAGEIKKPLAKDATPEQTAQWRKDNGIPENAADYLKSLPDGIAFGESDKPAVDNFLAAMHGKNASPELVAEALASYHKAQTDATAALQARDLEKRNQTEEVLRKEWQSDYRPNITAVKVFMESNFPEGVQEALMSARLGDADGTPLLCNPDVIRAFAQLGRSLNPAGTITSGKGMESLDTINDAIKSYEKRMGGKEWFKDEKSQAHYRELVTARDRLGGKK